jgi:hypothetical protein
MRTALERWQHALALQRDRADDVDAIELDGDEDDTFAALFSDEAPKKRTRVGSRDASARRVPTRARTTDADDEVAAVDDGLLHCSLCDVRNELYVADTDVSVRDTGRSASTRALSLGRAAKLADATSTRDDDDGDDDDDGNGGGRVCEYICASR